MPPKRFALYYHIWSPPNSTLWRLLVDEQIKRMMRSGVVYNADVFCCITGPQHADIERMIAPYDWLTVLSSTPDERKFEGETLARLHEACSERPDLEAVGYVHTKGIRHFEGATPTTFRAVNSWRHFLEWGSIDRWRDAVAHLQAADAVGVNYRDSPWPHFSGNFWWARASYIRSLASPVESGVATTASLGSDNLTQDRATYEKWIGLNNPKVFSFYDFPFRIPGRHWTYGFDLYQDDIYPLYEGNGL